MGPVRPHLFPRYSALYKVIYPYLMPFNQFLEKYMDHDLTKVGGGIILTPYPLSITDGKAGSLACAPNFPGLPVPDTRYKLGH